MPLTSARVMAQAGRAQGETNITQSNLGRKVSSTTSAGGSPRTSWAVLYGIKHYQKSAWTSRDARNLVGSIKKFGEAAFPKEVSMHHIAKEGLE